MFKTQDNNLSLATFGLGCFWKPEEIFKKVKGVKETAVGYMGGNVENPTYENVCSGATGHAEVIQLKYDPAEISYEELLDIFWRSHNPTTLNRQGFDVGEQYRSVIFYHTSEQKEAAEKSKEELENSGSNSGPIVTEIVPASTFYRAEEYHQRYLEKKNK
jgi:peptide-methionine (S)-S-oxide reductase